MSEYIYSKSNPETGYKTKINRTYDFLPDKARWLIFENRIKLHERKTVKPKTEAYIYQGVDSLQYLGIARKFVEQRFKISRDELDVFLYLYPFHYFTKSDYTRIARPFISPSSIKTCIKKGHIIAVFKRENLVNRNVKLKQAENIYSLSLQSKRAVNYFYKLVSGEMKPSRYKTTVFTKEPSKNKLIKDLLDEMQDRE